MSYEWRVHLSDRLNLGDAIIQSFAEHEAAPENLPVLPREVLAAIAEAVKPGPSHAEMARLEEALIIERGRVDLVLDRRVTP